MTKENIAILLTPCIFWCDNESPLIEMTNLKKLAIVT